MFRRQKPSVLERRLRSRVIVTLKSGESFSGLLAAVDAHSLVVREAEAIGVSERGANLAVDGEIIVLVDNVAFLQRP